MLVREQQYLGSHDLSVGGCAKARNALDLFVLGSSESDTALRLRSARSRDSSAHRPLKSDDIKRGVEDLKTRNEFMIRCTKRQGREFSHNKFLAETIKGRKPGKALDIGMGEGRNALFLATQGWEVTGFDISDVGVQLARETAQKRGLKLETLVDDVDRFDYGRQRWDLDDVRQ
jgi:SAM-dependent methyltransferase